MLSASAVLALATIPTLAQADPIAKSPPETCPDGFLCGALSARLAAVDKDYAGAFVAVKRACNFDDTFCSDYARLLVTTPAQNGGDAKLGMRMLEERCAKTTGDCAALARYYDRPPKGSGLTRDAKKAEQTLASSCHRGDVLDCSALGDLYLKGGPDVPIDKAKARASMERGCSGTDHYAAGVCGSLADHLAAGKFGPPDPDGALPYLEKSCAQGYRCDLGVKLALDRSDLAKAKTFARRSCERWDCELIGSVGTKDPAWAKATYAELCQRGNKRACSLQSKK